MQVLSSATTMLGRSSDNYNIQWFKARRNDRLRLEVYHGVVFLFALLSSDGCVGPILVIWEAVLLASMPFGWIPGA